MEKRESLERDLTLEVLEGALTCISDKTSSGEGGLTKEFYQPFFGLTGKEFRICTLIIFLNKGSLSISQKRRTIALIPKGYVNLTDLNNWRPISSLNIGYNSFQKY